MTETNPSWRKVRARLVIGGICDQRMSKLFEITSNFFPHLTKRIWTRFKEQLKFKFFLIKEFRQLMSNYVYYEDTVIYCVIMTV